MNKININGYIEYYLPSHHRASITSGCVYEHILVAEDMLGRELYNEEVVHHIDGNKSNNKRENLMVFATKADHTSFHQGGNIIGKNENGAYITDRFDKITCPICGNKKDKTSCMCINCARKKQEINIPPKDVLDYLIHRFSFVKIGNLFNVSDNAIRKWCKKYNLSYKKSELN